MTCSKCYKDDTNDKELARIASLANHICLGALDLALSTIATQQKSYLISAKNCKAIVNHLSNKERLLLIFINALESR